METKDSTLDDLREHYIGSMVMIHINECYWITGNRCIECPFIILDFKWSKDYSQHLRVPPTDKIRVVVYDIISQNEREIDADKFSDKMRYKVIGEDE